MKNIVCYIMLLLGFISHSQNLISFEEYKNDVKPYSFSKKNSPKSDYLNPIVYTINNPSNQFGTIDYGKDFENVKPLFYTPSMRPLSSLSYDNALMRPYMLSPDDNRNFKQAILSGLEESGFGTALFIASRFFPSICGCK